MPEPVLYVAFPQDADQAPLVLFAACQKSYSQPVEVSTTVIDPSLPGSGAASAGTGTPAIVRAGAHDAVRENVWLGVLPSAKYIGIPYLLTPIRKPCA